MADRLGAISPSGFVANTPIVVEPRAIQALTEAFRSGQIRAEEIADRAMVRPAQQAAATLAADPQLVEAKKRSMLADASTAEVELEAKQLALKNAQQQANIPPIVQQQNAELATKGLQVFPDTGGTWTPEKSLEVGQLWKDLKHWEAEFSSAAAQKQSLKEVDITQPTGAVEKISYEEGSQRKADPVRAAGLIDWIRSNATPRQWIESGKQPSPSLFGPAPGEIAAPAAPVAAPVAAAAVAPPGTAPVAAPVTAPVTATAAFPTPGGLIIKPAGLADKKAPTEMQAKASTAVARMISSDEVLKNLQAKGFNPGTSQNWMQDYLIGPFEALKTSDKKTYDTASASWIQGLLRLESGAAIAAKEQKWYEQTFFARPGDPLSVQQIKLKMRSDVEAIVGELSRGGGLDVPALINVRKQGETLGGGKAPSSKPFTTSSGRFTGYTVTDPNTGNQWFVPVKAGAVSSSLYVQPKELSSGSKSKPAAPGAGMVEPKSRAGGRF